MIRGITFEIPNEYGHWLAKILKSIDCSNYNWFIGSVEGYTFVNKELVEIFPNNIETLNGDLLVNYIGTDTPQYIVHADLKAYPLGKQLKNLKTFEDFHESECQFVLLIVDCTYTTIYCKNSEALNNLYSNAEKLGVNSLTYISEENDFRTRLSVW
ncbi:DUF2691 family protein [Paenibacillus sp. V4I5]|uniref:DUF2691 family protein n=1 Tax=Paenibacillus sp. V4I5 TaxID=3042306 RepID=UPI002791064A|nr:DUF2691 family protein [Paenibacillus sp. V4I5]MDQ0917039.1 hypothetical protein [Paenibacillus sp. V4I5]